MNTLIARPPVAIQALTPAEVAMHVTLKKALAVTSCWHGDDPNRAFDAFHEACHIVSAAHYRNRTIYVYVPKHDAGGNLLTPKGGLQQPGQTYASMFPALWQVEDVTYEIEDAVVYYAGIVAECILLGWNLPELPNGSKSDHACGVAQLESFTGRFHEITRERRHKRFGALTDLEERRHIKSMMKYFHGIALNSARALVSSQYGTIDAVAAMILLHGENGGLWWSLCHQDWLAAEMRKAPLRRDSARRETWIRPPKWLGRSPSKTKPFDFTPLRRNLDELMAGQPPRRW